MNRMKTAIVVLVIVSLLWAPALFAQQRERQPGASSGAPLSRPGVEEPVAPKASRPEGSPMPKASTFLGSSVMNPQGEKLGTIDDLVINPATGRIIYAALSHGSFLGLGGKLFAVSWDALKLQPDGKSFILNVSKETLDSAPSFDKHTWPQQPDPALSASATGTAPAPGIGRMARQTRESLSDTGVSATVQNVDVQKETIRLKTEHGQSMELQAPATMLQDLQAGDAVQVKMVGTRATEIRKQE